MLLSACAPAPLYTGSAGNHLLYPGGIPRDSRGEPVWHLIEPASNAEPVLSLEQVQAIARAEQSLAVDEGSGEGKPYRID